MRTYVRITPDIEKGNQAISNGTFERILKRTMDVLRPETAFFYAHDGKRTANFIFDLEDQSDIPRIAEPWFNEMNARVELFPCMNGDDVQIGLGKWMADIQTPSAV